MDDPREVHSSLRRCQSLRCSSVRAEAASLPLRVLSDNCQDKSKGWQQLWVMDTFAQGFSFVFFVALSLMFVLRVCLPQKSSFLPVLTSDICLFIHLFSFSVSFEVVSFLPTTRTE